MVLHYHICKNFRRKFDRGQQRLSYKLRSIPALWLRSCIGRSRSFALHLHACGEHHIEASLCAEYDFHFARRKLGLLLRTKHPFLPYPGQGLIQERLWLSPDQKGGFILLVVERGPFSLRYRARTKTTPMNFSVPAPYTANVLEEEQRNRAPQPFFKILLDLLLPMLITDFDRRSTAPCAVRQSFLS